MRPVRLALRCDFVLEDSFLRKDCLWYTAAMCNESDKSSFLSGPKQVVSDSACTDVDTTLIDEMLRLTPEERLCYHNAVIRGIYEIRKAFAEKDDGTSS
jgi:hypothetical protein